MKQSYIYFMQPNILPENLHSDFESKLKKIIKTFDEPANQKKGVITVEGKMVERLHLVMARRVVAIADAINSKSRAEEPWF